MQKENLIILAQIPANTHILASDIFISLRQCYSMSYMFFCLQLSIQQPTPLFHQQAADERRSRPREVKL